MSEHAKRIKRELVMKGTILDVYKWQNRRMGFCLT